MATCRNHHSLYLALIFLFALAAPAQLTAQKPRQLQSPASGASWAAQAMLALTGGNTVSSVSESGSVTRTVGGDQEQGSITLQSSGVMNSEMDITTSAGVRTLVRTMTNGSLPDGYWTDLQGKQHPIALHNLWSDAVWFFPALSLLADYADPNLIFEDLGQVQYQGQTVEDIRVHRTAQGLSDNKLKILARVSTVHYFLDSQTAIPEALAFDAHSEDDLGVNIPSFFIFSDYRSVNGVLTPYSVTKFFNGTPMLQITVSSVSPNNLAQGH